MTSTTQSRQTHTVCPHCKRPVVAQSGQRLAECLEHGQIVPMRSAIVNSPLPLSEQQRYAEGLERSPPTVSHDDAIANLASASASPVRPSAATLTQIA